MTSSRQAYFQRLGIEVWVRRHSPRSEPEAAARPSRSQPAPGSTQPTHGRARPASPPTAPAPPAASEQPVAEVQPPPATPSAASTPQAAESSPQQSFRIRCFRYGSVFVAIAEDAWPRRRFLIDVARAMNRFQSAQRRELAFDWPQPGAGVDGGERAFRAFMRHQTLGSTRGLIAGARVPRLLGHAAPAANCVVGGHVYVVAETPDAEAKKALWRLIRELG